MQPKGFSKEQVYIYNTSASGNGDHAKKFHNNLNTMKHVLSVNWGHAIRIWLFSTNTSAIARVHCLQCAAIQHSPI